MEMMNYAALHDNTGAYYFYLIFIFIPLCL
jgi:hypothetical protein